MRLRVALEVSIGSGLVKRFGGCNVSDWSRDAANKLRKRLERKDEENAALTEKRRLLEEQGPALWQQVCELVKKQCDDLNADYEENVATVQENAAHRLRVELRHAGNMSELNATFNISTSTDALKWSYVPPRTTRGGTCALHVNAGRVGFQDGLVASTPESIAMQMLNGLLAE